MAQLWKNSNRKNPDKLFQKYTVGSDYLFDLKLFPFDIQASIAHIKMLAKIKLLSQLELEKLLKGFEKLIEKYQQGKIKITEKDEDCHTVIENEMVKICGDTAKKIHTGRSRNDQVLTAVRLYCVESLNKILQNLQVVLKDFYSFAEKYQKIPFPGYSHTRQAMLSSLDHYFLSYLELLLNDYDILAFAKKIINQNPLGTGAGYGSSFPLDREFTTKELNFNKIQINSLATQNSKGKLESMLMHSLLQVMTTLGKFSNDMIFFTVEETAYFSLSDNITTGSSMMPQKRNPDAFEILRANVNVIMGNANIIENINKNLLTGYNRDTQIIKKPLFESLELVQDSIDLMHILLKNITPNIKEIENKISKGIFAADIANDLVKQERMPFRDAYHIAMNQLENYAINLKENITSKISLGAPGNTNLKFYKQKIKELNKNL